MYHRLRLYKNDHIHIKDSDMSAGGFGVNFNFSLSDFTTEKNWDYYKIDKCIMRLTPKQGPGNPVLNVVKGAVISPIEGFECYSVVDKDINLTVKPTTADYKLYIMNSQNTKTWNWMKPHTIIFKPAYASAVMRTPLTTEAITNILPAKLGYGWLNMVFNTVKHYGVSCWFNVMSNTESPEARRLGWYVQIWIYVSFKKPIIGAPTSGLSVSDEGNNPQTMFTRLTGEESKDSVAEANTQGASPPETPQTMSTMSWNYDDYELETG